MGGRQNRVGRRQGTGRPMGCPEKGVTPGSGLWARFYPCHTQPHSAAQSYASDFGIATLSSPIWAAAHYPRKGNIFSFPQVAWQQLLSSFYLKTSCIWGKHVGQSIPAQG